jgi:hypothetical protein
LASFQVSSLFADASAVPVAALSFVSVDVDDVVVLLNEEAFKNKFILKIFIFLNKTYFNNYFLSNR